MEIYAAISASSSRVNRLRQPRRPRAVNQRTRSQAGRAHGGGDNDGHTACRSSPCPVVLPEDSDATFAGLWEKYGKAMVHDDVKPIVLTGEASPHSSILQRG